jgi:DNA-binding response OmpR family regulator
MKTVPLAGMQPGDQPWVKRQPHILVVDDEESILSSLREVLSVTFDDFCISTATSAEEALDILYDRSADLLITDLKLPEMDGLELTRSVKSVSPDTHSILITAYGNGNISDMASNLGCLAYLEKPFDIDVLLHYASIALEKVVQPANPQQPLDLKEILRLYMKSGKDAVLSVISDEHAGYLVTHKGRIIHAQFREMTGCDALLALIELDDAFVRPLKFKPPKKRTLSVSWHTLEAALELSSKEKRLALLRGRLASPGRLHVEGSTSSVMRRQAPQSKTAKSQMSLRDQTHLIKFEKHFKEQKAKPLPLTPEETSSSDISALVNTGIAHFQAHRLREAERFWRRALELDQNCKEARNNLAVLQMVLQMRAKKAKDIVH